MGCGFAGGRGRERVEWSLEMRLSWVVGETVGMIAVALGKGTATKMVLRVEISNSKS